MDRGSEVRVFLTDFALNAKLGLSIEKDRIVEAVSRIEREWGPAFYRHEPVVEAAWQQILGLPTGTRLHYGDGPSLIECAERISEGFTLEGKVFPARKVHREYLIKGYRTVHDERADTTRLYVGEMVIFCRRGNEYSFAGYLILPVQPSG